MEYNNKTVEIRQRSEDVKTSMSSSDPPDDLYRKSGVPETSIHGVRAETVTTANTAQTVQGVRAETVTTANTAQTVQGVRAETVTTANTAQTVHGGMDNNYFVFRGRPEEFITEKINQLGIGTQIDNNVLQSTLDTPTTERKSRVRLESESEKYMMVEDQFQQHRQQVVTGVAKDAATVDAADGAVQAATDVATDGAIQAATEDAADGAVQAATEDAADGAVQAATDVATEDVIADATQSGNDASMVSALYRYMGILFRGRNASQLEECLPGLELRDCEKRLHSKGISVERCNEESAEDEKTENCIEADWVIVSTEGPVFSTPIVHNEEIPRKPSDDDDSIPSQARCSQPMTTQQSQGLETDNKDQAEIPFDTGGRHRNGCTESPPSALAMQPENQEIRLGNQVKECTTPHENKNFLESGNSHITRDATNGGWTPSKQGTGISEMQHKHLLEQWNQIDERDQSIVKELLNGVIYHARNQPEGLRKLLPRLREMSRDIDPRVPFKPNQMEDLFVRLFLMELTAVGLGLSRKTATNVANYILTIGKNNPKSLCDIVEEMEQLDDSSYQ